MYDDLDEYLDQDRIRQRVRARLSRIRRLIIHIVLTIGVIAASVYAAEEAVISQGMGAALSIAAVAVFVAHAMWLGYHEASAVITRQEIERERERAHSDAIEKEKRASSASYTITDDGELIPIDDEQSYQDHA